MREPRHHRRADSQLFWALFGVICLVVAVLVLMAMGLVAGWPSSERVAHEGYAVVCPELEGAVAYAGSLPDQIKAEEVEKTYGCGYLPVTGGIYVEKRASVGGQPFYCLRHESEEQCRWKREIPGTPEGAAG